MIILGISLLFLDFAFAAECTEVTCEMKAQELDDYTFESVLNKANTPAGCAYYFPSTYLWIQTCENSINCGTDDCPGCKLQADCPEPPSAPTYLLDENQLGGIEIDVDGQKTLEEFDEVDTTILFSLGDYKVNYVDMDDGNVTRALDEAQAANEQKSLLEAHHYDN